MSPWDLQMVAKRVVWFKKPEDALRDTKLFLAHVMTYGTLNNITATLHYFSESDFEAVLDDPPPGIFDRRSLDILERAISSRARARVTQAEFGFGRIWRRSKQWPGGGMS